MDIDESNGASSTPSTEEDQTKDPNTTKNSEGVSDKTQGSEPGPVPYHRFKEVNDVARWYRENIGNPNDVIEFQKWKTEQVKAAKEAESDGDISAKKLAEIRKLMRNADPEYREMLEERKREKESRETEAKQRMEAQFDDAEEEIRSLAAEQFGYKGKTDEAKISKLAQYVMLEIQNDEKLMRKWMTGNLSCVKTAWKNVLDNQDGFGKSLSKLRQEAMDKRRVSKLPTLPSASGSLTGQSSKTREKGITKEAHDDAWAVLQQSMQD